MNRKGIMTHQQKVRNKIEDYLKGEGDKTLSGLVSHFIKQRMSVVSRDDLASFARRCFPNAKINYNR